MANLQDLAAHWRVAPQDLDPVETKEKRSNLARVAPLRKVR